jgi:hypothetical protein
VSFSEPARLPATTFRAVCEGDRFVSFSARSKGRGEHLQGARRGCSPPLPEQVQRRLARSRSRRSQRVVSGVHRRSFSEAAAGPRSLPIGARWSPPATPPRVLLAGGGGPLGASRSVQAEPTEGSAKGHLRGLPRRPYGGSDWCPAELSRGRPRGLCAHLRVVPRPRRSAPGGDRRRPRQGSPCEACERSRRALRIGASGAPPEHPASGSLRGMPRVRTERPIGPRREL